MEGWVASFAFFIPFLYKPFFCSFFFDFLSVPNVLLALLLCHCFEIKSLKRRALAVRNVCGGTLVFDSTQWYGIIQGCVTRYHSMLGAFNSP